MLATAEQLPSVDDLIAFTSTALNNLFDGSTYSRLSTLPKLLHLPELWLMPGGNINITEVILADLEALLSAQTRHLQRSRVDLFDVSRFWALVQAIRGERKILSDQLRRLSERTMKRARDEDE